MCGCGGKRKSSVTQGQTSQNPQSVYYRKSDNNENVYEAVVASSAIEGSGNSPAGNNSGHAGNPPV